MSKKLWFTIFICFLVGIAFAFYNFVPTRTDLTGLLSKVEHHSPPSVIIEPGSGVESASYIIFHDDETPKNYYAKNGLTGEIEFSGTSANTVIQSTINALTDGGEIFIKAGTYSGLDLTVPHDQSIGLIGEGFKTILQGSSGNPVISLATVGDFWTEGGPVDNELRVEHLRIEAASGEECILSDPTTSFYGPRWVLNDLFLTGSGDNTLLKVINPYKIRVTRIIGFAEIGENNIGIWLLHDYAGFHSGDSYFEDIDMNIGGSNAVGILLDATPTQDDGILNLIVFNKIMLYSSGEGGAGVKFDASNNNGGSIDYIDIISPCIEDFGTVFLLEGSLSPAGSQRGHVSCVSIRGTGYNWGTSYGIRNIGEVGGIHVKDIYIGGGATGIRDNERNSDTDPMKLDGVFFSTLATGSATVIIENCPWYP